jgi:hypothetical protein
VRRERREPGITTLQVSRNDCRNASRCVSSHTHKFALPTTHFSGKYQALLPMIDILEEFCAENNKDKLAIAIDTIGKNSLLLA